MNQTEETSRLREAFAKLSEAADGGRDCPPPDLLWKAVNGEIGRRRRRRVIDHISQCGRCALEWRLAAELGSGPEVKRRTVGEILRNVFGGLGAFMLRPAWMGTVAMALLAIGLWTMMPNNPQLPPRPDVAETIRGEGRSDITSLVPDTLPRDAFVLRWRLREGLEPVEFTIIVSADSEEIVRKSALEESEFLVPPEALNPFPGQTRIVWQVKAILSDGTTAAEGFSTYVK